MTIDWPSFTPVSAATGGALIGIGSAMFVLMNGRIAGISGILGGLLRPKREELPWRLAFLGGLLVAPTVYALVAMMRSIEIATSLPTLVVAGLLVGFGTRYGSGCTSGHGICGVARLSARSLVAVACFVAMGFLTVFVVRKLTG